MKKTVYGLLAAWALLMPCGTWAQLADRQSGQEGLLEAEKIMFTQAFSVAEKNPVAGRAGLQAFLEKYPRSVYADRAMAMTGVGCSMAGDWEEAIIWFKNCDRIQLPVDESRRATLYSAIAYLKEGRYDEARLELKVLDLLGGDDADVLYYRAYLDYCEGKYESARDGFEECLEDDRYAEGALLYLADISNREGKYEEALKLADALMDMTDNPTTESEAERVAGGSWYGLGSWKQADALLTSYVLGGGNAERQDYYQLGMAKYNLGEYERAKEYLAKASASDDAMAQNALFHLGLADLKLGENDGARMAFEQASAMTADRAVTEQALYNYAMCVQESSYSPFNESVNAMERFINEFPDSKYADDVNSRLVTGYLSTSAYEAALESVAKIKNPSFAIMEAKQQLLYRRGVELYAGGSYDEAPKYLTDAIDLSSYGKQTAADAYFWRGETYFRQGKYADAARDYSRCQALSSGPGTDTYGMSLYGGGYSAYKRQDWAGAMKQWNELISHRSRIKVSKEVLADAYARTGDCNFYGRNYDAAYDNYNKAIETWSAGGDYPLYRMGMVRGLQQRYRDKIALMSRVVNEYPESGIAAQALYEQGRAYQQLDEADGAIKAFSSIVKSYPQSDLARKAAAEIASVYYQNDRYNDAIKAYEDIVKKYPGSDEAALALRDLKSIYVETGQVDRYASYVETVRGAAPMAATERDSLTYISAERQFSRGAAAQAKEGFQNYLQQFPSGAYVVNSHYYLGQIFQQEGDRASALKHYLAAADFEHSRYCTESLQRASALALAMGRNETARDSYIRLLSRTTDTEVRQEALFGIVTAAYALSDYSTVIKYADQALAMGLPQEKATTVRYDKVKSMLATGKKSDVKADLKLLAADTRSACGAEGNYLLSQLLYDAGDVSGAETNIMSFIQGGTPHMYWLARSFILLSDIYVSQDKKIEARQYLLSLKQNYTAEDDIAPMIEERLKKLE